MRRAGLLGACWPSPLQTEVLRAAVLPPADAAAAWDRVRPAIVLDDVWDGEVHRLLPLVHRNLVAAGVDDPDLPRLKGIRRRTWYENQMRVHQVHPALEALGGAGIELVFLKGIALGVAYYGDLGLRPMQDVDVLVPRERAAEALDLLEGLGWYDAAHLSRDELWRAYHGSGLLHPGGGAIDVHWHLGTPLLLPGSSESAADQEIASMAELVAGAEPFADARLGLSGHILRPEDLLLHALAHALWAGSNDTTRWAADATEIVRRRGEAMDWDRLVDQAQRRRIAPLVADGLRFLRDEVAGAAPDDAIAALDATPMRPHERRLLRALTGSLDGPARLGGLPHLRSYWAYTRLKWGPLQSLRELPPFVARLWHLDSVWQLPAGTWVRVKDALRPAGPAPDPAGRPEPAPPRSVAVVIPTHHRPDDLRRCLDALAAQLELADQVIVVRGADDLGAAGVVADHEVGAIDIVAEGTTQVDRMHAGAGVARAAIVAFTDDDAAPRTTWVAQLRRRLADPTIGAVGGRDVQTGPGAGRPHPAVTTVGRIGPGGRIIGGHADGTGSMRDVDHLRGVNLAVRRDLLRLPAGLRGRGAQGYNELAICLAVKETGHRVVYDPELLVDHHLAARPEYDDRDGRGAPSTAQRADDAFNQSYILLSMRPRRRWARLAYVSLLGDRSTGGALRCTVAAVRGDKVLAGERRALLQAHLDADRAARSHPLELRSPGWLPPDSA